MRLTFHLHPGREGTIDDDGGNDVTVSNPNQVRHEIRGIPTWVSRHHRLRHSSLPSRRHQQRSFGVGFHGTTFYHHYHHRHHNHHSFYRNRHRLQHRPSQPHHHHHLPTFFYMVMNRSWNDVLRRCETHSHEITMIDPKTGNTPLHIACQYDPPCAIIQCLTTRDSFVANAVGATPLHVASTHRCSAQSLQLLIDVASTVASEEVSTAGSASSKGETMIHPTVALTHMGRAPIHSACMSFRGLDFEAFSVLLESTLKHGNRQTTSSDRSHGDYGKADEDDDDVVSFGNVDNDPYFIDDVLDEDDDYLLAKKKNIFDWKEHKILASSGAHLDDQKTMMMMANVMALCDTKGYTPLGLLFRRYRHRVKSVISVIDKIRVSASSSPSSSNATDRDSINMKVMSPSQEYRAAVASALTVQADLGALWGKARIIVARLTEERLYREGTMLLHKILQLSSMVDDSAVPSGATITKRFTTCSSPAEFTRGRAALP